MKPLRQRSQKTTKNRRALRDKIIRMRFARHESGIERRRRRRYTQHVRGSQKSIWGSRHDANIRSVGARRRGARKELRVPQFSFSALH